MQTSFWMPGDFQERFGELWLVLAGGNLVMPNVLRVRVNGYAIDYRAEPARATISKWESSKAWDYRIRLRIPLGILQEGENSVLLSTHMLPGLVRVMGIDELSGLHNMSLASVGVDLKPRD